VRCDQAYTYHGVNTITPLPSSHPHPWLLLQINPITVIGLLEVSGAKAGEHIVITAAGSTLGRMLIAAAKAQGIQTIGVVRRAEAVQELKDSTG
jgi:NADPH:quinone reductase-like Zn-dependent oxidoreductase